MTRDAESEDAPAVVGGAVVGAAVVSGALVVSVEPTVDDGSTPATSGAVSHPESTMAPATPIDATAIRKACHRPGAEIRRRLLYCMRWVLSDGLSLSAEPERIVLNLENAKSWSATVQDQLWM